jgi:hypothetical protein
VKRTLFFGMLFLTAVAMLTSSCGTGDKIASLSISAPGASGGFVNLAGLGSTLQLQVMANYTSGKMIDETNFATYTVTAEGTDNNTGAALPAPPLTLTINATGMVTAVDPAVCTWDDVSSGTTPAWAFTGDYKVIATYRGFTSNPIFIPVASAASNQAAANGQCGPTS